MSLVVETGSIVSNANTYASLETVTTYHTTRGNSGWLESSEDAEPAIMRAMRWLESRPFVGSPLYVVGSSTGQPLQWPRVAVYMDGLQWPSDEIPPGVISALCEAALIELEEPGALAATLERGGQVKTEKVDVLSTTYFEGAPVGTVYQVLQQALSGLVKSGNVVRLVR
jgi:hypothetical protein